MVYAGLINKQAVAGLQAAGCNALGLSGADGNAVTARRRSPQPVDYGFVGDIERVDSALLRRLLEDGMAPVFSAIMHDGKGTLLNCNADSVASAVALGAAEIAPTDLVFCFEKAGVLRNPDDDTTLSEHTVRYLSTNNETGCPFPLSHRRQPVRYLGSAQPGRRHVADP